MLVYTVLTTLFPLLIVGFVVFALTRPRTDPVPPQAWQAPVAPGLVRVTGQVLGAQLFSPTYRIRYPLPDGTDGHLRAVVTRPRVLRAGMLVPVLVDPSQPHRARLDVPAHASIVRLVATVWTVIVGVALVAGLSALALYGLSRPG